MNRENAIEGRAEVQVVIDQNRRCLPRGLERGFSTQAADKVLALSKITGAMGPGDLQFTHILWSDLGGLTEVTAPSVAAR